ncbi:protein phosphatase Slingshot isoform X1 [Drosophila grimshawi]|uniref:protein phosphatase Slingshot isoform X1 n=2 Tax=Drosophila grimshawi TaxID=7222 RepID=UPI000C86EBD8|nr:protein phosphatase Slingshot isoform X1 [Drosophila grimshawi]
MALVTVQRSPSVTGSCSNSDGEADDDEGNSNHKGERSECYFAGKGTALVLALEDKPLHAERRLSTDSTRSTNSTQSNNSDIQLHLQSMFYLLHREDTLKMAVKLESQRSNRTRYLVIVSRSCCRTAASSNERRTKIIRHNSVKSTATTAAASSATHAQQLAGGTPVAQRQLSVDSHRTQQAAQEETAKRLSSLNANRQSLKCDVDGSGRREGDVSGGVGGGTGGAGDNNKNTSGMEESCLLGIDCNERTTLGLVVPILADTTIHLDGDGGFSVAVYEKTHIFKPVSVQAMWSALQTLHKVSRKARENNFYPSGPSHDWLTSYESRIESDQSCLNEWNAMDALESRRPPSPDAIRNKPTAKEETESVIKMKLKAIMMSVDLDEVTSKYIRGRLEDLLDMDLGEYKSFIDAEMLLILGQMDAPTKIFEHVYLGSEWNASNLEELQKNGVRHILNVTREIDNFFPGTFEYFNVRVYDDEKTNLLKYWDDTFRYISRAKAEGSKVLVHCKMGVSRSASVVIAYAMKAYKWEFQRALQHVKERRSCIKPNKNFLNQLETYSGMLDAMKNKEKLQRSKSETNLKSTKDARLLPGSEPTPLIQALNHNKSKLSSSGKSGAEQQESGSNRGQYRRSSAQKQRRLMRRSSSTSPKTQSAVEVTKQQSQSMENLTPERSVAEEPKNMRFPGSNGENYSVTQNQVLHIQKHTPLSVRTRVHDLEAHQEPPRRSLHLVQAPAQGTVWTSQSKLITQTAFTPTTTRRDSSSSEVFATNPTTTATTTTAKVEEREKRQRRKTQSWTESFGPSGGIILDALPQQHAHLAPSAVLRTRVPGQQRELPSRHASWGSGDNRSSLPMRTSSCNYYDSNRNTTAIFEGEIQDLKRSSSGITSTTMASNCNPTESQLGTVKRTKQKLEENTTLKKRCQEANDELNVNDASVDADNLDATTAVATIEKKCANLYRSASSAGNAARQRQPLRCNSEELMHTSDIENKNTATDLMLVLRTQSQAVAEDQRISGHVQILKQNFEAKAGVVVGGVLSGMGGAGTGTGVGAGQGATTTTTGTGTATVATAAAPVQKKATHQSLPSSPVAQHADHVLVDNSSINAAPLMTTTTKSSSSNSSASDSSVSETSCDRNVKGLVHKYQTTSCSNNPATITTTTAATLPPPPSSSSTPPTKNTTTTTATTTNINNSNNTTTISVTSFRQRPHSYYDRSLSNRAHDYSENRPPPAPARHTNLNQLQLQHQQQQQQQQTEQVQHRRLAQHGKTHPLTRLSLPKQSFNTAAYNTM